MLGIKRPRESTINHPVYSVSIPRLDSRIFDSQQYYASVSKYLHLSNENHINDCVCSALELYGAQACRANGIGRLLFTLKAYKANKIPFHAILILNGQINNEVTVAILFDKASDVVAEQFKLRFVWWTPQNRYTIYKDDIKCILLKHIPDLTSIPEQIINPFYAKQYPSLPKDMPRVEDFIASKGKIGTLVSQSHFLSSTDLDGLECTSERLSETLDYRVYNGTDLSENLKTIARQQAFYLKREEGYDLAPYDGGDTKGFTFYFIVTGDNASCVGSLIFKKIDNTCKQVTEKSFQILAECNKSSKRKIPRDTQDQYRFFESKVKSAKEKYMAAKRIRETANPDHLIDIFTLTMGDHKSREEEKQERLFSKYKQAKFAAGMRLDEASLDTLNNKKIMELKSAWIHPYFRRRGILTALWPKLVANYHLFSIDYPSRAMRAFLEKQNSLSLSNNNSLCAYKP